MCSERRLLAGVTSTSLTRPDPVASNLLGEEKEDRRI